MVERMNARPLPLELEVHGHEFPRASHTLRLVDDGYVCDYAGSTLSWVELAILANRDRLILSDLAKKRQIPISLRVQGADAYVRRAYLGTHARREKKSEFTLTFFPS